MALPASTKTPQVRASIIFGSAGATPSSAPKRILLIGSKIGSDITTTINTSNSTTTSVTTTAGIAALDVATRATSPDHAAVLAGRGSELHLAAIATFAQYRTAEVWLAPLTPGGGAAAGGATITPTISGLSAGTLRITVMGESVDIGISASDTVSTIGLKITQAINNQPNWPVTATNTWATGAVAITAKWLGPRSNAPTVRAALLTSVATIEVTNGTGQTAFGLTITMSGGTADGGVYRLSGGATDDNVTNLLTAITPTKFDRIAFAGYRVSGSASANLARITSQLVTLSDNSMFDQQVVFGSVESPGNNITVAQGNNSERGQWVGHPGSDDLPLVIAAQVAAARLFGDSVAGGSIEGEATNPACNLNDLELATLRAPRDPADLYDGTETEAALNAGVTPLKASPTRTGRMSLVSSITMRSLAGGLPDFSVDKTKEVTVADWARAAVVASLQATYRGFNLVNDNPDGTPVLVPKTVSPSAIEERIYGLLKDYEKKGYLTDVDAHRDEISVTRNGSNPRRVDYTFPTVAPSDYDIADGTIYQRQASA